MVSLSVIEVKRQKNQDKKCYFVYQKAEDYRFCMCVCEREEGGQKSGIRWV